MAGPVEKGWVWITILDRHAFVALRIFGLRVLDTFWGSSLLAGHACPVIPLDLTRRP